MKHLSVALALILLANCRSAGEVARAPLHESDQHTPLPTPDRSEQEASTEVSIDEQELLVSVDDQGRATKTYRLRYRIVDERTRGGMGKVSATWAPWYQDRPELTARVTSPDGQVAELDPTTISEAAERDTGKDMYSDRRIVHAPLPSLAIGSVVETQQVVRDREPYLLPGSYGQMYLASSLPIKKMRLVVELPESAPFAHRVFNADLEPKIEVKDGRRRVTFEAGPLPVVKSIEHYPADLFPRIAYSTHTSWEKIASTYAEIVDKQLAGADVRTLIADAKKEKSREKQIAAAIKVLHQKIRYVGLELRDAAIVPRTPKETLSRGYGDCKDKSILLIAMLRALGIEAHAALVNSAAGFDAHPELPSLAAFDHLIVHLPNEKIAWIDATDELSSPEALSEVVRDRHALVARAGTKTLITTPPVDPALNRAFEKRELFLADFGPGRAVETSWGEGAIETRMRAAYANKTNAELAEEMKTYAKNVYGAEKIDKADRFHGDSLNEHFRLHFEISNTNAALTEDDSARVLLNPLGLFQFLPKDISDQAPEKREVDLLWTLPYRSEIQYRIVPPQGFVLRAKPKDEHLALGPATVSSTFQVSADGALNVTYLFDMKKARYTGAEATAMHAALADFTKTQRAVDFDYEPARLMASGELAAAIAKGRALIKANPKNAFHHVRIADAYLSAGFGGLAREEAKIAATLAPKEMLALFKLGWTSMQDELGRQLRPGADLEVAVQAFRRAKAAEPLYPAIRQNLAYLLEHNADLVRYGKGARLDEALAEYRELRTELAYKELDNTMLVALFRTGRYSELREQAKEVAESLHRNGLYIAAIALVDGKSAALEEANQITRDAATRTEVLSTAANWVTLARKYTMAAELISAAGAPTGSDAIVAQRRIALFSKIVPIEQKIAAAQGVERAYLETLRTSSKDQNALVSEMIDGEGRMLTPEVLLDFAGSALQVQIEGDDRLGYRVRAQVPGQEKVQPFDSYFVVEKGKLTLRATSANPLEIAAEVLDRVNKKELDSAEKWADWAEPMFMSILRSGDTGDRAATLKLRAAAIAGLAETGSLAPHVAAVQRAAEKSPENLFLTSFLIEVLQRSGQQAAAVETSKRALQTYPNNDEIFWAVARMYDMAELDRELIALCESYLMHNPAGTNARMLLANKYAKRGELETAAKLLLQLMAAGQRDANVLNTYAWNTFLRGKSAEGLEYALEAAGKERSAPVFHTLATLYAETDKPAEAMNALRTAAELRGSIIPVDGTSSAGSPRVTSSTMRRVRRIRR